MNLLTIPCSDILADPEDNVSRCDMSPHLCQDIAASIHVNGLMQPVTVRPVDNAEADSQFSYELVMGFRRFTAVSINLGLPVIKAFVVNCTKAEARIMNLTENLQRKDLTFWEQSRGLKLAFPEGTNRKDICKALGYSDDWVKVRWDLWKLPKWVRDQTEAGIIGSAEINIIRQQAKEDQVKIARRLISGKKGGKTIKDLQRTMTNRKAHRSKAEVKKMMTACMERDCIQAVHALRYACGEISDTALLDLLDNPQ